MHLRLRKCEKSPQTYRKLAVAEHLLQFCGICGCGIEFKFAVPSSGVAIGFLQRGIYHSRKTRPDRKKVTAFLESAS